VGGSDCETLARFTTGQPALLECIAGAGRVLVFASDLNHAWNDFPRHATFVPFLHETVAYLSRGRVRSGDFLVGELPAGVAARPGIARLPDEEQGGSGRLIAVNVDPAESDPGRLSAEQFQAAVTRSPASRPSQGPVEAEQREAAQSVWRYILVLMMAVLILESAIGTRTA
jgi:hypothetical protein